MALLFDATTERVALGSGASLDNIEAGTILTWVKRTNLSVGGQIYTKTDDIGFTAGSGLSFGGAGSDFYFDRTRATLSTRGRSVTGVISAGVWYFLGAVWNTAGVDADQKLYQGTLTSSAAEPTYTTQRVGSGTVGNDAAFNATLGNFDSVNENFDGTIAWVGIWNRVLTLGEVRAQQFRPHVTSGCVLFTHLGWNSTGSQPDWSGNDNTGTVTGATVAAHVPLGPAFGFAVPVPYVVAATIQKARPSADVADGLWTNEAASNVNLYASIDETAASDTDYIQSALSPSTDLCTVRLGTLTDPAVSTGHVVRYRYQKDTTGGEQINLVVRLYAADGTTVVASQSHTTIDAVTDGSFTLSGAEADAIPGADYATGLVLGFEATAV